MTPKAEPHLKSVWLSLLLLVAGFLLPVHFSYAAGTIIFHPTGDGSSSAYTLQGTASADWDALNDQTANAATGAAETANDSNNLFGAAGNRSMFTLADGVIPAGSTITQITIHVRAWRGTGQAPTFRLSYQRMTGATTPDGSPVDSADVSLTTGVAPYSITWSGLNWTADDIDNLQIGMVHVSGGGASLVSQMYVAVTGDFNNSPALASTSGIATQNVISSAATGVSYIDTADMDGDGDLDAVVATFGDNTIAWYENDGSQNYTKRTLTTAATGAYEAIGVDLDQDGDMDVLGCAYGNDTIYFFENNGAQSFTTNILSTASNGCVTIRAGDIDGDGDIDFTATPLLDNLFHWYENDGSENFTQTVFGSGNGAWVANIADLDEDGDIDLLTASRGDDTIAWYENNGNEGFTQNVIDNLADGAYDVVPFDIDGDGDLDLATASTLDSTVAWYENDGSESFTKHVLSTSSAGAFKVAIADIDLDGDMDIFSASTNDDTVAWFENDGSENFTARIITSTADFAAGIRLGDADGDGDLDIFTASQNDNTIAWYENNTFSLFTIGGSGSLLHSGLSVSDQELDALNAGSGNYSGAIVTLARSGGANSDDVFGFTDGNGITLSGGNLIKSSQIIASFDITSTSGQLVITFTDANGQTPTTSDVNNILQQIIYSNGSGTPPASVSIITTFNDGNTGSQGSGGALEDSTTTIVSINVPPTLSSSSPADNATDVLTNANIVLTFSEDVKAGSGNIVITDTTDGTGNVTIAIGDAQVSFSGNKLTINPSADFESNTDYDITIASGVIVDNLGSAFSGITTGSLNFTTGTAPIYWDNGGADTNVSTAGNWNPDTSPSSDSNLIFDSGGGTISWDSPSTVSRIALESGFTGKVQRIGDATVTSGITINSGTFQTTSVITTTDLTIGPDGVLDLYINNATPGLVAKINATGTLTPGGTLKIWAFFGVEGSGQTLDILDWGTLTPNTYFDNIDLPFLTGGLAWDLSNLYVDGTIKIVDVPGSITTKPKLWLDASDAGTVNKDASNRVKAWFDKTSYDFHADGTGHMPTWVDNQLNGKPVIRFSDSPTGYFTSSMTNFPRTILVVARERSGRDTDQDLIAGARTGFNEFAFTLKSNFYDSDNISADGWSQFIVYDGSWWSIQGNDVLHSTNKYHIFTATWAANSNTTYSVDGVSKGSTVRSSTDLSFDYLLIGAGWWNANFARNVDIAELIIFDSVLSGSDIAAIESYLTTKYNLNQSDTFTDSSSQTDFVRYANDTLTLVLDSTTDGLYGRVDASGTLTPAGTLIITETITEAVGQTFDILNWGTLTPNAYFHDIQLPTLSAGLAWDLENLYVDGTITIVNAPGKISTTPKLWLDVTDDGSLYKDASDNVYFWMDKSGNNNNAEGVGHHPTLEANQLNTWPVLRFDLAPSEYMFSSSTDIPRNAFVVAKEPATINKGTEFISGARDGFYEASYWLKINDATDGLPELNVYNGIYTQANGDSVLHSTNKFHLIETTWVADSDLSITLNGGTQNTTTRSNPDLTPTGTVIAGNWWAMPYGMEVDLAEVLFFDTVLSAADRLAVSAYLTVKYSIEANMTLATSISTPSFTAVTGKTYTMVLDSKTDGEYARIDASGNFTAAGTLTVTNSGLTFAEGDSFNIINGNISGTFSSVNLPTLSGNLVWSTANLYTSGEISIYDSTDATAPTLSSTSPTDNATGIAVSNNIVLTFSENIKAGSGNIVITDSTDGSDNRSIAIGDSQVSISGNTLTLNLSANLEGDTAYDITLASGVITDLANNAFGGISTGNLNFTTSDSVPPTLSSASPTDNATNVATNSNIVLTFNENVQAGSGNIVITDTTDGTDNRTIAIGDAQVSISGTTVTINPSTNLENSTDYDVTIASGVITDLSSNVFAGISSGSLNFTTQSDPPPTLSSSSPTDNATAVAVASNIVLTFSENVQAGTGNIVITDTTDGSDNRSFAIGDAQVSIAGNTVTINPSTDLETDTDYDITIASGVIEDLASNAFAGITTGNLNFTTIDTLAPTLSSITPNDNATDVTPDTNIVLSFNEGVQAGTGNIVITDSTDGSDNRTIAIGDAQASFSGSSLTLDLTTNLELATDYDITIASGVINDLAANAFTGITTGCFNFTTVSTLPSVVATLTTPLIENTLDTQEIILTLTDETFLDSTLSNVNFTFNNPPSGLSVGSVTYNSSTQATLVLSFDNTDFDTTIENFSITVAAAELTGGNPLTTGSLSIFANVETQLLFDDFNSGTDINGRTPPVINGSGTWVEDLGTASSIASGRAQVRDGERIRINVDTTNYRNMTLDYDREVESETSYVYYSLDGTNFTQIALLPPLLAFGSQATYTFPSETENSSSFELIFQVVGAGPVKYLYLDNLQINATPIPLTATPGPSSELTETNLDDQYLDLTLNHGETFADTTLNTSNFQLYNFPMGTSIESVTWLTSTTARLNLAFDGTDFNTTINDAYVSIGSTELTNANALISNSLQISPKAFISEWLTTTTNETITLPLLNGGNYNFSVDWGDGSTDQITSWNQAETTHTYATAGTYTVKITGTLEGFAFNNGANDANFQGQSVGKIRTISQWGDIRLSFSGYTAGSFFESATNLDITATDAPDLTYTTSFWQAFANSGIDDSGNLNSWDVSQVTTMRDMFNSASSFNQDLSSWDMSNVGETSWMFNGATAFNQDIGNWNVSNVGSGFGMYGMFAGATSFDQDLSNWNISGVNNLTDMFVSATLSTPNYDALLIGWDALELPNGLSFGGGNSKYCATTARASIISTDAWTITDGGLETGCPTISTLSPSDEATGVAIDSNLILTFSENVQAGSGNIIITDTTDGSDNRTIPIGDAQVSISTNTVTINPSTDFESNTSYEVTIKGLVILDTTNLTFDGLYAGDFNFTTVSVDATAPTLSSSSPTDNATGVAAASNVVLTFDENVQAGSGNIVITDTNDGSDNRTIAIGDAQVSISGNIVTINPTTDLDTDTDYDVTIASGVIEDLASNAFAGISSGNLNFTTVDTTAPTLSSASPTDNATAVAVGSNIVLTFSESVQAGTGNIVLTDTNDGSDNRTIAIGDAQVSISGNTVTLNPTTDLDTDTDYDVTIASGVIEDLESNAFAGISIGNLNFTTIDTTAPTLSSSTPTDNASAVVVASNIVLTFSESVQAGTGNIVLTDTNDGSDNRTIPIGDAQVSISGNTVTINPSTNLDFLTDYEITIAAGVIEDLASNAFAGISSTNLNFTTDGGVTATPDATLVELLLGTVENSHR